MFKGSIQLSCGCTYEDSMGDIEDLVFEYETEDCDPVEGLIPVIISGIYCKKCQESLNEQLQQEEVR